MGKVLLVFILSVYCCSRAVAQPWPDLTTYSVEQSGTVTFDCTGCGGDMAAMSHTEVPPWIIGGSNHYHSYFMTTGRDGGVFSIQADLLHNNSIPVFGGHGPFWTTFSGLKSEGGCPSAGYAPWRRDYYGIYSAQYYSDPTFGPISMGYIHAENKDVCADAPCHNDFNTAESDASICNMAGADNWPGYNAMVCASWVANNASTNWGQKYFSNDLGPITWPSIGYLNADGTKASCGVGIPSSIQYDGYVYVFYVDHGGYGFDGPPGRQGGIKVVRAQLENAVDPRAYKAYYLDPSGNDTWNPSLPDGFSAGRLIDFLKTPGPLASDIMGETPMASQPLRFSVARVRNTNYFIGVESYIDVTDGRKYKNALRFSSDLIHWTARQLVISTAKDFFSNRYNYPVFLSADGWSNNVVDLDNIYVLGTSPGYRVGSTVYRLHVYPNPLAAPNAAPCGVAGCNGGTSGGLASGQGTQLTGTILYPNPTSNGCTIQIGHPAAGTVDVAVFDATGRQLKKVEWMDMPAGTVSQFVDLSDMRTGIYFIRLDSQGWTKSFKVVRQ